MQSDGNSFCGDAVLDSDNMASRVEDIILDQIYEKIIFLNLYIKIIILKVIKKMHI